MLFTYLFTHQHHIKRVVKVFKTHAPRPASEPVSSDRKFVLSAHVIANHLHATEPYFLNCLLNHRNSDRTMSCPKFPSIPQTWHIQRRVDRVYFLDVAPTDVGVAAAGIAASEHSSREVRWKI